MIAVSGTVTYLKRLSNKQLLSQLVQTLREKEEERKTEEDRGRRRKVQLDDTVSDKKQERKKSR